MKIKTEFDSSLKQMLFVVPCDIYMSTLTMHVMKVYNPKGKNQAAFFSKQAALDFIEKSRRLLLKVKNNNFQKVTE